MREELSECSAEEQAFFEECRVPPRKWAQSPWGDRGGGFWVVARYRQKVLWFNDIEYGFNVSRFENEGRIPGGEYWCSQDTIGWALSVLKTGQHGGFGPPENQ
jgi:hypothetical protein